MSMTNPQLREFQNSKLKKICMHAQNQPLRRQVERNEVISENKYKREDRIDKYTEMK